MERVYISGAITGVQDYESKFARAEEYLKERGYEVINPVAMEKVLPKLDYEEYMKLDMAYLDICDAIFLLKGWAMSRGANREYGYALAKGYRIMREV